MPIYFDEKNSAKSEFLFNATVHCSVLTKKKLYFIFFFQFTSWVDAVIFVFSLENETSFNAIYNYYAKMSQYRNMHEIPLILVGTQGMYTYFRSETKIIPKKCLKVS